MKPDTLSPSEQHGMLPARIWSLRLAARVLGLRDEPPSPERVRALSMGAAVQEAIELSGETE